MGKVPSACYRGKKEEKIEWKPNSKRPSQINPQKSQLFQNSQLQQRSFWQNDNYNEANPKFGQNDGVGQASSLSYRRTSDYLPNHLNRNSSN